MGSSSPMGYHSYCRVRSQQTERDGKLGAGLLRMEASSPVISENLSTEGNPVERSICFQTISSDQDLLFAEAGSIDPSSRCLPTKLVSLKSLSSPPPLCMIPKVLSKVLKEKAHMMILITPAWLSPLWYPEAMEIPYNNQFY